ncbi:MAG: arabinogalactan endo-1,4-beta-galactosidase [Bacteroidetes bacterium]|nr:arabinogalactan endo-1,4-beta-galactosidase [Bacteroidota bacterium]
MDLSFQPELTDWQTTFYDENGNPVDVIPYYAGKGANLVRLRLWHSPSSGYCDLEHTLNMAQKVKQQGMDLLLSIQFSDSWSDPGHQQKPLAWEGLSLNVLKDSVGDYTKRVVSAFRDKNILPAIIQIGNETNAGFLWNEGRVGGSYDSNWPQYVELVERAASAIREVDTEQMVKIMMHFAGYQGADWYYNNLKQNGVDYDIMGISFYSIWHGKNLDNLKSNLISLGTSYNKYVLLTETSYPWTLAWNDWTNNPWGEEGQLIPGYPATPEGQLSYLLKIKEMMKDLGGHGIGFCYWAPDWVAFKGPEATTGSTWENATLFDFDNKALPANNAFED